MGVVDNGILIYFVAFAALWIMEVYVHVVIQIYDYISSFQLTPTKMNIWL